MAPTLTFSTSTSFPSSLFPLQAGADNLLHFQWSERADASALAPLAAGGSPTPELDLIIMPEEKTRLSLMPRPPGARIFKLAFEGDASRDLFLWAQEPDASGDEASVESFNRALNTTIEVEMGSDGDDDEGEGGGESDDEVEYQGPISAAYLAGVLRSLGMPPPPPGSSAAGPSKPRGAKKSKASAGGTGGGGGGQVDARALAAALAAAAGGSSSGGAAASQQQQLQQQQQEALREMLRTAASGPSLGEILRPDLLLPLLFAGAGENGNETVDAIVERLSQHAPEGHRARGREGVEELASSAQLRSQADAFSSALTSGELDLSHFGLRAQGFSVADFLQAVQDSADAEKKKKEEEGGGRGAGGSGGGVA